MDKLREQQMEALQTAGPYCDKIAVALDEIIEELKTMKRSDTDEYLKRILNGLNWIFEVYNGTQELVAECGVMVDKDAVNQSVSAFNKAGELQDDAAKAEALKGICEFVRAFKNAADQISA